MASYTYYNAITRSQAYNETPSPVIPLALARGVTNPLVESALKAPGLFAQNRKGSLTTDSLLFLVRPQRQAARGIQYGREVTNQELSPREIREVGFFTKAGLTNG